MTLYSLIRSSTGTALGDVLTARSLFSAAQLTATGTYRSYTATLSAVTGNDKIMGWGGPLNWTTFAASRPSETLTIANHLNGGDGNDRLFSGQRLTGLNASLAQRYALNETLAGGLGNDSYYLSHTKASIAESSNSGTDLVVLTPTYLTQALSLHLHSYSLSRLVNVEKLTLQGSADFNGIGNGLGNIIQGNTGQNMLYGGDGRDFVYGGLGNDRLYGGTGNDVLQGGDGNDILYGDGGDDVLIGGAGDDCYVVDSAFDSIFEIGFGGTDKVESATIALSAAAYIGVETLQLTGSMDLDLAGGSSAMRLYGNAGRNMISSGSNEGESLYGGAGDDQIRGLATFTHAELYGGTGNDSFEIFDQQLAQVHEDANAGYDVVSCTSTSLDASTSIGGLDHNIEALQLLGAQQLALTGGGDVRLLGGNMGRNTIYGGTADETILGGGEIDTLFGGAGNDMLIGGGADDEIYGGAGNDSFVFGLIATDGIDYLDDFQAGDRLDLHAAASQFTPGTAVITSLADVFNSMPVTLYQIDFDADGTIDLAFMSRTPILLADITAGFS